MKVIRIPLLALIAMLSAASAATAADAEYPIRLTRPSKVGDAYSVKRSIESKSSMTIALPGQPAQTQGESLVAELACRCDVTEVDAIGGEKTLFLTVGSFTAGPDKHEAVAPGKIIDIKRGEKEVVFALRDGDLSPEAQHVLEQIYSPLHNENGTDDDAYGSKTPRKVGESWAGNAEIAAKQASDPSVVIDPKNLTATTLLKGVETVNGTQALRLVTTVDVKGVKPSDLPPGFNMEASDVRALITTLLPTNLALQALEESHSMDIHLACSGGAAEAPVKMVVDSHVLQKSTFTEIKK